MSCTGDVVLQTVLLQYPPVVVSVTAATLTDLPAIDGRGVVRVGWTVTANATGSPIERIEIERSINGRPYYLEATKPGSKRTLWRLLRFGRTYQFRVRAITADGQVSAWETGSVFDLSVLANTSQT